MKTRILSLMLTLILLLSTFAGCSSTDTPKDNPDNTPTGTSSDAPETEPDYSWFAFPEPTDNLVIYTDPYYDLAKLSHSICGCYDFFNSGLYEITVMQDLSWKLTVDVDAGPFVAVFRRYLQKNGIDYRLVRLYEAGLFLSMLPYHMDQPGKVFGFLLNAIGILDEVE